MFSNSLLSSFLTSSTPSHNTQSSPSVRQQISNLFIEINDFFEEIIATFPECDRVCDDILCTLYTVQSKLQRFIQLIKEDENTSNVHSLKPYIAESMHFCALANRAVQDSPKGSMLLLFPYLTDIIDKVDYPLLSVESIYLPLSQLLHAATYYSNIHTNCYEADHEIYAHYVLDIGNRIFYHLLINFLNDVLFCRKHTWTVFVYVMETI
jgi:hypothetical protein